MSQLRNKYNFESSQIENMDEISASFDLLANCTIKMKNVNFY